MRYSTSTYSVTLKTVLGVVQGHWKWRRSIDHIRLFIGPQLYISGTVFELFDVEWYRDHKIWVRGHSRSFKPVPVPVPFKPVPFGSLVAVSYSPSIVTMGSIVHQFRDKAKYWSKIVIFSYPLAFDAPVRRVPIGILPSRLVWKN